MTERTLVLLKPDAIQRGLVGRIIARLEDAGLKIVAMRMTTMDEDLTRRHYADLEERIGAPAFAAVARYVQSGPVLAMAVEGHDAVPVVRKLIGATVPAQAAPGTIRADFCHHGPLTIDGEIRPIRNLIHASGSPEEAAYELALWFTEDQVIEYATANEQFTF
ncbi:MAG: nucleoside-diphosphate kinase [Propionibacteriaceae bacterium]|nr:nucleoside-diphosphate kinase [Propionibacteriaceae bacterium]